MAVGLWAVGQAHRIAPLRLPVLDTHTLRLRQPGRHLGTRATTEPAVPAPHGLQLEHCRNVVRGRAAVEVVAAGGLVALGDGALVVNIIVIQPNATPQLLRQGGVGMPPLGLAQELLEHGQHGRKVDEVAEGLAPHAPAAVRVAVAVDRLPALVLLVLIVP